MKNLGVFVIALVAILLYGAQQPSKATERKRQHEGDAACAVAYAALIRDAAPAPVPTPAPQQPQRQPAPAPVPTVQPVSNPRYKCNGNSCQIPRTAPREPQAKAKPKAPPAKPQVSARKSEEACCTSRVFRPRRFGWRFRRW